MAMPVNDIVVTPLLMVLTVLNFATFCCWAGVLIHYHRHSKSLLASMTVLTTVCLILIVVSHLLER